MGWSVDQAGVAARDQLIPAMAHERLLLVELRGALARQRAGVAGGDPAALEVASQAVSRAILTLDEARRRREQLTSLLAAGATIRLDELETVAGPVAGLADARQALRAEAEAAARDLAETQQLLQAAIRAGDVFLQSLFASVTEATLPYGPPVAAAAPATGLLVNRSA